VRQCTGADSNQQFGLASDKPSSGEWWMEHSSYENTIVYRFSSSTDKPVLGDSTEDGKTDAAFFRPFSGEWFVLRSENLSLFSLPFGIATDVSVPADYDGGGIMDAAFFRDGI